MNKAAILGTLLALFYAATLPVTARAESGPSDEQARQILHNAQPLAKQGNANAQYNMGVLYDEGYGLERDYAKAMKWYKKAARQDYAKAEHNLGIMYQEGHGVKSDLATAAHWFKRAAKHGEPAAQNNLAVMYVRGQGVDQNLGKAGYWIARAAKAGNKSAITNLPHIADSLPAAKIKGSGVNIRAQPSRRAQVVRHADNGQPVRLLGHRDKWTHVLFAKGYTVGWVADFLLAKSASNSGGPQVAAASGSARPGQGSAGAKPPVGDEPSHKQAETGRSQTRGKQNARPKASASPQAGGQGKANASARGSQPDQGVGARIAGSVVNIRAAASKHARVVMQAHHGDEVTVIGRKNQWRHIRLDHGRRGWVAAFLLSADHGSPAAAGGSGPAGDNPKSGGATRHIAGNNVNIRQRPSTRAGIVFQAHRHDAVTVIGKHRGWRQVRFEDGRTGWVAGFLLGG